MICVADSAGSIAGSVWGGKTFRDIVGEPFSKRTPIGSGAFISWAFAGMSLLRDSHYPEDLPRPDVIFCFWAAVLEATTEDNNNLVLAAFGWLFWLQAERERSA